MKFLPLCSVRRASIQEKVHSLKKGITYGHLAKSDATVLSPFACGEVAHGNSVVLCIRHPSFNHAGAAR